MGINHQQIKGGSCVQESELMDFMFPWRHRCTKALITVAIKRTFSLFYIPAFLSFYNFCPLFARYPFSDSQLSTSPLSLFNQLAFARTASELCSNARSKPYDLEKVNQSFSSPDTPPPYSRYGKSGEIKGEEVKLTLVLLPSNHFLTPCSCSPDVKPPVQI